MPKFLSLIVAMLTIKIIVAQAASFTDPAQAYYRILLEKNASATIRIGSYLVKGTPYLFGENNFSIVYLQNTPVQKIIVNYNTYTQELEIFTDNKVNKINSEELDSFLLKPLPESEGFNKPLLFVNGKYLYDKAKNQFYQNVATANRFSLYKKYYSDLGYVSTNYIQSELREFDLKYDYYYTDTTTKMLKKLKLSNGSIIKEFKKIKDVSSVIGDEQIISNPEAILTKVILYLNE